MSLLVGSACIQVEQQTAGDIDPGDTTVESDAASCSSEEPCDNFDVPCTVTKCVNGACVAVPADGFCEPADACGDTGGFCLEGECVAYSTTCSQDAATGCTTRICDGNGACADAPITNGVCLADAQKPAGTCSQTFMNPVDICQDDGTCQRRDPPTTHQVDTRQRLLDDTWWVVMTSPGRITNTTRAGFVSFDENGNWQLDNFESSVTTDIETLEGKWCSDNEGGMALRLRAGVTDVGHIGHLAAGSNVFALASAGDTFANMVIGLRMDRDMKLVTGTYHILLVRPGDNGMDPYVGTGTFANGHFTAPVTLTGPGNVTWDLVPDLNRPLDGGSNNRVTIGFSKENGGALSFKGGIGAGGRIVLMVPSFDGDDGVTDGMLVLARSNESPSIDDGSAGTLWGAPVLQYGGAPVARWQGVPTVAVARRNVVYSGLFGTQVDSATKTSRKGYVRGGSVAFGSSSVVVNLVHGDGARTWLGYVADPGDFGFIVDGVGLDAANGDAAPPLEPPIVPAAPGFGFVMPRPYNGAP